MSYIFFSIISAFVAELRKGGRLPGMVRLLRLLGMAELEWKDFRDNIEGEGDSEEGIPDEEEEDEDEEGDEDEDEKGDDSPLTHPSSALEDNAHEEDEESLEVERKDQNDQEGVEWEEEKGKVDEATRDLIRRIITCKLDTYSTTLKVKISPIFLFFLSYSP